VDTTIQINGMSCAHCVAAVKKALTAVPGVTVREVAIGRAVVTLDPAGGSLAAVEAAIDDAGYDVVTGRVLNIAPAVTRDTTPDA
jgi:copper chaperone CopZ